MNDEDKTTDDVRGAATTTPVTTEFVRRHYSMGPTAYYVDGSIAHMPTARDVEYAGRQFDEWLARHDAEVRDALTSRPAGPCPDRYPDPADDVQCWLTAGHEGEHIVDGGTYRWSTPPAAVLPAPGLEVRPRGTVTDVLQALATFYELDGDPESYGWTEQTLRRMRGLLQAVGPRGAVTDDEGAWEYGVRHVDVDGWPTDLVHGSIEAARTDLATCGWNCYVIRRRAAQDAGQWEPVEAAKEVRP